MMMSHKSNFQQLSRMLHEHFGAERFKITFDGGYYTQITDATKGIDILIFAENFDVFFGKKWKKINTVSECFKHIVFLTT